MPTRSARQLALDTATDRVGEIMPSPVPAALCKDGEARTVWLRPVGGGAEWTTRPEHIELIDGSAPSPTSA